MSSQTIPYWVCGHNSAPRSRWWYQVQQPPRSSLDHPGRGKAPKIYILQFYFYRKLRTSTSFLDLSLFKDPVRGDLCSDFDLFFLPRAVVSRGDGTDRGGEATTPENHDLSLSLSLSLSLCSSVSVSLSLSLSLSLYIYICIYIYNVYYVYLSSDTPNNIIIAHLHSLM